MVPQLRVVAGNDGPPEQRQHGAAIANGRAATVAAAMSRRLVPRPDGRWR